MLNPDLREYDHAQDNLLLRDYAGTYSSLTEELVRWSDKQDRKCGKAGGGNGCEMDIRVLPFSTHDSSMHGIIVQIYCKKHDTVVAEYTKRVAGIDDSGYLWIQGDHGKLPAHADLVLQQQGIERAKRYEMQIRRLRESGLGDILGGLFGSGGPYGGSRKPDDDSDAWKDGGDQ